MGHDWAAMASGSPLDNDGVSVSTAMATARRAEHDRMAKASWSLQQRLMGLLGYGSLSLQWSFFGASLQWLSLQCFFFGGEVYNVFINCIYTRRLGFCLQLEKERGEERLGFSFLVF